MAVLNNCTFLLHRLCITILDYPTVYLWIIVILLGYCLVVRVVLISASRQIVFESLF
jgi:hypothetical protein